MSRDLEQRVVVSDETYRDKTGVKLGGKVVDLYYYGPNDGDCKSVI